MDRWQLAISLVSGGLAGGSVSTISNRISYRQSLRTKLFPKLIDMYSAYVIRMEEWDRKTLVQHSDFLQDMQNKAFVAHRSNFIMGLVEFNEIKEVRELRKTFLNDQLPGGGPKNKKEFVIDLLPEYQALSKCVDVLHKKLNLW